MQENKGKAVLFICEKYYLRFYAPVAEHLFGAGFTPIWVAVDGSAKWDFDYLEPEPAIEHLAGDLARREQIEAICTFERAVFERPDLFKHNYPYILKVVRTRDRAYRLANAWYQLTLGLLARFRPAAVFLWNGRYLPYSAVSTACDAARQLVLTSEIGWLPGTMFVDKGPLSTNTTDLLGRTFESATAVDPGRADRFLRDYRTLKATMVSQTVVPAAELRQRLLAGGGNFLLLYGCQVDWDTNIVIGSRRFRSNEEALTFLLQSVSAIPGARVVVKTHPLDAAKRVHALREMVGDRGAVITNVHPHTLIEAADCVAVRNSTLGFETLCYEKPLLLLEHAKYRHPQLTLPATDIDEASARLSEVASRTNVLPNAATFRQLVLHLLDHYLVPARYKYHFDPRTLRLLTHLAANDSYRALTTVLDRDPPALAASADDQALRAVASCQLRHPRESTLLRRRIRTLVGRFF